MTNVSRPESMLSKKHSSIAYHCIREAQAAFTLHVGHVHSEDNYTDMLTKCLNGVKLHHLASQILKSLPRGLYIGACLVDCSDVKRSTTPAFYHSHLS
jgi:hypothetical protein